VFGLRAMGRDKIMVNTRMMVPRKGRWGINVNHSREMPPPHQQHRGCSSNSENCYQVCH
jgi:hypothetical protein